jgi:hypothetical protein
MNRKESGMRAKVTIKDEADRLLESGQAKTKTEAYLLAQKLVSEAKAAQAQLELASKERKKHSRARRFALGRVAEQAGFTTPEDLALALAPARGDGTQG